MKIESEETFMAEYVLGVLDAEEHAYAEKKLIQNHQLRERAVNWSLLFSSMRLTQYPNKQPPVWLGMSIQNRLPKENKNTQKVWALAASLAALALTVLLWGSLSNTKPDILAEHYAQLSPKVAGLPAWHVELSKDLDSVMVKLVGGEALATQGIPVLWALKQDGTPQLIGALPTVGDRRIALKDALDTDTSTRLAISLEPKGVPLGTAPRGEVVLVANWDRRD